MSMSDRNDVRHDPDGSVVREPNEARQGREIGRMRYVLAFGIAIVVIAFIVAYFIGRT